MSTTVDNRVVQMTFNNKQFEKGVDETLKTIDKLNKALKFKDASEGFDNIQDAANSVDFRTLSDNVKSISDRFSGLGIIGAQIWARIGNAAIDLVTGPFKKVDAAISGMVSKAEGMIVQGGWNRALNLEKAEFMLKNLGYGWDTAKDEMGEYVKETTIEIDGQVKTVKNAYKAIAESVDGTAFSMDQAASAAANFLAAGVDAGDELYDTLRSVQGLSSVFNTDFDQVAGYFQKIASSGALTQGLVTYMTQTIKAPITEILKESLGLSTEELNEALQDGLISFETFRDVMLKEYGDSLDKANDSFTGVTNNIRSAFGRIGAQVAEPLIKKVIPALNTFRLFINKVNSTLKDAGIYNFINNAIDRLVNKFDKFLTPFTSKAGDAERELTGFKTVLAGILNIAEGLGNIFNIIGMGFKSVFGGEAQKALSNFSKNFFEFSKRFLNFTTANPKGGAFERIFLVFRTLARVIKLILPLIRAIIKLTTTALGLAAKLIYPITLIISAIVDLVEWFNQLIKGSKTYAAIINLLHKAGEKLSKSLSNLGDKTKKFIKSIKDFAKNNKVISGAVDILKDAFSNLDESVAGFIDTIANGEFFTNLKDIFETAFTAIGDAVEYALGVVGEFFGIDFSSISLSDITAVFKEFFEWVGGKFTQFKDDAVWAVNNPKEALDEFSKKVEEIAGSIGTQLDSIFGSVSDAFSSFTENILGFKKGLDDSSTAIDNFNNKSSEINTENTDLEGLSKLGEIMTKLGDGLTKVKDALKDFGSTVWQSLLDAFHLVQDELDVHSFKDFLELIKEGFKIFMAYNIGEAAGGMGAFFTSMSTIFRGQRVSMFKLVPDMILKIAAAFAILAYSIRMLSRIDTKVFDNVVNGMRNLVYALSIMAAAFKAAGILGTGKAGTVEVEAKGKEGNSLAAKLPKYLANQLGTAAELASVGALLTGLAAVVASIAGSIAVLTKVVDSLEDPTAFSAALGAVIGVLAVLFIGMAAIIKLLKTSNVSDFSKELGYSGNTGNLRVTNDITKGNKSSVGNQGMTGAIFGLAAFLVGLSVAMLTLTAVISVFVGLSKAGGLWEGVGALAAVMALMTGMMAVILLLSKKSESNGDFKGTSAGGIAAMAGVLVTLGNALLKAAAVVILLGHMDPGDWGQGMLGVVGAAVALAIMMAAVTFLLRYSKGDALDGCAIIIACSSALLEIAGAIKLIASSGGEGNFNFLEIIGLLVIGTLMCLLLAAIPKIIGKDHCLEGAAIILACSSAILEIAGAIKLIEGVKLDDLWDGLIAILIVVGLIIGVGFLAGNFPTLGAGLNAVGTAFLKFGGAIFLAAAGLALLIAVMEKIGGNYDEFCDNTEKTVDYLIRMVVAFINGVVLGICDSVVDLADALLKGIIAIVDWLSDHAAEIGVVVGRFFAVLVEIFIFAVAEFVRDVIDAFIRLFESGFEINSPSKVMLRIGKFIIQGLLNGIKAIATDLWEFVKSIPGKIIDFLLPDWLEDDVKEIGGKILGFLGDGIKGAVEAVTGVIGGAVDAVIGVFDAASDTVEGLMESVFGDPMDELDQKMAERQAELDKAAAASQKYYDSLTRDEGLNDLMAKFKKEAEIVFTYQKRIDGLRKLHREKDARDLEKSLYYQQALTKMAKYGETLEEMTRSNESLSGGFTTTEGNWYRTGTYFWGNEIAKYLTEGFASGMKHNAYISDSATAKWVEETVSFAEKKFGIESPSKVFKWIARMCMEGYGKGIDGSEGIGIQAIEEFSDLAIAALETDIQPTITPVLDLSTVQNGASQIGAIFSEGAKAAAELDIKSEAGRTADTLESMSDIFNKLVFNTDSTGVEGKLDVTAGLLTELLTALSTQQLVLDTGAVVGGIAPAMDKELGMRSIRVGRRV